MQAPIVSPPPLEFTQPSIVEDLIREPLVGWVVLLIVACVVLLALFKAFDSAFDGVTGHESDADVVSDYSRHHNVVDISSAHRVERAS